jgi:transcriptional regulator with XRE-family HTH domain
MLYRWERGKNRPNDTNLENLAKVLQVEVHDFLMDPPDKTATPDPFAAGDVSQLERIERKVDAILAIMTALAGATPDAGEPILSANELVDLLPEELRHDHATRRRAS